MRILALSAIGMLLVSGGTTSRPGRDQGARDTTIVIKTFQFRAASLVIPAGTRVVWTNADDIGHTITAGVPDSASGGFSGFNGPVKGLGATFAHTFTQAGTYTYFCDRHHFMRGEIRVTPTGEN